MMALSGCSRLTGILPRIFFNRNLNALACVRSLSLSSWSRSRTVCAQSSRVTFRGGNLLRSHCSVSDAGINVSHEQLKQVLAGRAGVVIDVREPWELREHGQIPGTINVPVGQVNQALQLNPEEFKEKYGGDIPAHSDHIVFSCRAGIRSKTALDAAVCLGYSDVQHYPGGWEEWAKKEILQTKH